MSLMNARKYDHWSGYTRFVCTCVNQQSCSRCVFSAAAMRCQDVFNIMRCFSRPSVYFFKRDVVLKRILTTQSHVVCPRKRAGNPGIHVRTCSSTIFLLNFVQRVSVAALQSVEGCHGKVVQTRAHANKLGLTLSRNSFASSQNSAKDRRPSFSVPSSKRFITNSVADCRARVNFRDLHIFIGTY